MPARSVTAEEVSQLIDDGLLMNEPGVGIFRRWATKWFAANPEQARGFLERQGLRVIPVGDSLSLNFIIEHPAVEGLKDTKAGLPVEAGKGIASKVGARTLFDPTNFDAADLGDVMFDIVSGGIIGSFMIGGGIIGGAGGLLGGPAAPVTSPLGATVGTAAGGAIGSAGVEASRQLVGGALGINTDADLGAVRDAAIGGAVFPEVVRRLAGIPRSLLRFAKKRNKQIPNIIRNLAAKIGGVSEEEITTASASAARVKTITGESARSSIGLLNTMRGRMTLIREQLAARVIPEQVEIDRLLEGARMVPMKGLLKLLDKRGVVGIGAQTGAFSKTRKMAAQIRKIIGIGPLTDAAPVRATGRGGAPTARLNLRQRKVAATVAIGEDLGAAEKGHRLRVLSDQFGRISTQKAEAGPMATAKQAQQVKSILQGQIDFSGKPEAGSSGAVLNKILKSAQGNLRRQIVGALPDSQSRARYKKLNGFQSFTDSAGKFHEGSGLVGRMESISYLEKKVGEHLDGGSSEMFLEAVTKGSRGQEARMVRQFDRLYGTDFVEAGTQTRLAARFSGDAAKLTATGEFIGTKQSAAIGAGIGYLAGGPEGAAVGGVLGFGAGFVGGAPKSMLRLARGTVRAEGGIRKAIGLGGKSLRTTQPVVDFLSPRVAATASAMSGRERDVIDSIHQQSGQSGTPQIGSVLKQGAAPSAPQQLSAREADPIGALIDELNANKDLTGAQRKAEFDRRSLEIQTQAQGAQ